MAESEPQRKGEGAWRQLPRWKRAAVGIALVLTLVGGGLALYNQLVAASAGSTVTTPQGGENAAADTPTGAPREPKSPAEDKLNVSPQGLAPSDNSGGTGASGGRWPELPGLPGGSEGSSNEGKSTRDDTTDGGEKPGEGEESEPRSAADAEGEPDVLWPGAVFRLGFGFFVGFCIGYAARMFMRLSFVAIGVVLLALFGLQYAGLISVDWTAMSEIFDRVAVWLRPNLAGFKNFITGTLPSAASGLGGLIIGLKK